MRRPRACRAPCQPACLPAASLRAFCGAATACSAASVPASSPAPRRSFRNRLYSAWVNRHAYRWHIVTSGLIILVISIAAILFGLGLVIVVIQLAVRLICSNIADVDLDGITTADVCVTIPSLSGARAVRRWREALVARRARTLHGLAPGRPGRGGAVAAARCRQGLGSGSSRLSPHARLPRPARCRGAHLRLAGHGSVLHCD